jgi:glycosidase
MKIKREAILHIPSSQYAFAGSETSLTIRLRAARGNLTACTLYYGDRACPKTPVDLFQQNMRPVAEDALYTYFETTLTGIFARVCYAFRLETEEEESYYYAGRFTDTLPEMALEGHAIDVRSEYYQYPYILRSELAAVPAWLRQARVYNIFPDSFATAKGTLAGKARSVKTKDGISRNRLGGTLRGVTENLDYIRDLGCTCLYLNPIFAAESYHKYDVLDYYQIDPCFGTNDDLKALTAAAHARGMRVILDGVFNHTSSRFFAFQDVVQKGSASVYADWFYDVAYPVQAAAENGLPNYACFAYVAAMPKLNTANPAVQQYFAKVGAYWIRECGIDGWRLDVANEITKEFWRCFKKAVRGENPEAVLIGEVWENAKDWLGPALFDSVMNYDFRDACRDFFALSKLDAAGFDARVTDLRMRYPEAYWRAQLNLLDSHDVCRFLSLCGGDERRMRLAILFQMLYPGVPSVFYGDEQDIFGVTEEAYRAAMPWKAPTALNAFYRTALRLHMLPAVQQGSYRALSAAKGSGLYGFALSCKEQTVEVWLNAGAAAMPLPAKPAGEVLTQEGLAGAKLKGFGWCVVRRPAQNA